MGRLTHSLISHWAQSAASRSPMASSTSTIPVDFSLATCDHPNQRRWRHQATLRPQHRTVSHNEEGTINVSQSRPIVTSSTSSLNNATNNSRSTVEYRDIGIQLTVKPLIGSDGTVQMEVEQLIEDVLGEVEIDGNEQPIIGKREATSYLSVRDRDVIVLGGLQENRQKLGDGSLEGLGDLPLIGGWFGSKRREYTRTELIIFIQPTILTNPSDAAQDTTEQIDAAMETYALRKYLETSDMDTIYVEESLIPEAIEKREVIEAETEESELPIEEQAPKQRPFIRFGSY